jgi:hypothetical protein
MNSPAKQKQFLEYFLAEKSMPFSRVIELLGEGKGKKMQAVVSEALNFLWTENLFLVKAYNSDEEIWISDELFAAPDNYYLEFNTIEGRDNSGASVYQASICSDDIHPRSEHHRWVGLKQREWLTIIGDSENATLLAEKVRAFTQHFAFCLTSRNYEKAAQFVSQRVQQDVSADALAAKMEYGRVDFFDHVNVISVYNGQQGHITVNDQLRLPPGVRREQRRGEASVKLISVYTPTGIAIHTNTLTLGVIEEEGFFKISSLEWHAD